MSEDIFNLIPSSKEKSKQMSVNFSIYCEELKDQWVVILSILFGDKQIENTFWDLVPLKKKLIAIIGFRDVLWMWFMDTLRQ